MSLKLCFKTAAFEKKWQVKTTGYKLKHAFLKYIKALFCIDGTVVDENVIACHVR